MPTTQGNRAILDTPSWQFMSPLPTATVAGAFIASSRHYRQQQLYVASNTAAWLHNPNAGGWVALPSPALAGTFGAGAAGCSSAWSTGSTVGAVSLTATSGTTSTIVTNQTLARDLRGYQVLIISGPNAGAALDIASNTVGANATITVATQATAFSASTVFRLLTPRWYVLGAGTLAVGSFKCYDFATNTWQSLSNTGLPATIGTDGKLVATPSYDNAAYQSFATGTATAGGASTLDNSAKVWTASQWINSQIRITAGTGAGQIRTISANTATQITVSSAWTTAPDATSQYAISGNDDFLYYIGNGAVAAYRYSISANTWSTLAPVAARGGAPGAGMSAHWIAQAPDADWTNENAINNGRFIYSFRGAAGSGLDRYDIPANTWQNVSYSPAAETFTTGSKWESIGGDIFGMKDGTGRWFRLSVATQTMDGWHTSLYPNSTAVAGDTCYAIYYQDGARIWWLYLALNSSNVVLRAMVF